MPSRKNGSSETSPASRRTSRRRLSSIASFHVLNPFNRRRSNNATDSTAASSVSNLSLSSTVAHAPQPTQSAVATWKHLEHQDDHLTALPVPSVPMPTASRRSSYVCLPDDPIGGMPRSRTFSNLPLPTRARRAMHMTASQSDARLPSVFLPQTRLPSPPSSSRKHSNLGPHSSTHRQPGIRNRLRRSDTEPLLPVTADQSTSLGRSTAFKENLSLSPVKKVPLMSMYGNKDLYGSALPSRTYAIRHGWVDKSEAAQPLLRDQAASTVPFPTYSDQFESRQAQSSPIFRSSRERPPTLIAGKPGPAQRWSSQPVLTNMTNLPTRRSSRHGEVLTRGLMAPIKPVPPPPPPRTPLSSELLTVGKLKSISNLGPLHQTAAQIPSTRATFSSKPEAHSTRRNLQQISTAEPIDYWCGRLSTLNDRFRNEELCAQIGSPRTDSDKMHTPEANTKRMRRALEQLHALCTTEEARESFVKFQMQLAILQSDPELSRPIKLTVPEKLIKLGRRNREQSVESCTSAQSEARSDSRRSSFINRIRRSLAV